MIFTVRLIFLVLLLLLESCTSIWAAQSVAQENQLPGTLAWKITNPRCADCAATIVNTNAVSSELFNSMEIQGYASATSVNMDGQIKFYISTRKPSDYTLRIFRVGWYGGLGGRLMAGPINLRGGPQPVPAPNSIGLIECHWPVAYTLTIPHDWVSGVYLAKLETAAGKQSYVIFTVRDDQNPSTYLYISPVNTYQAYNAWGGRSLYSRYGGDGARSAKSAYAVSFDRPYWRDDGAGDFLSYEINMVRWLEREGYDVSYATDVDVDENPDLLLNHQAVIFTGHSEYWSWRMRANVERARDQGVSLGFFAGNAIYWQARYRPDSEGNRDRTLVSYKEDALRNDPYARDGDPAKARYISSFWSNVEPWKFRYHDPVNRPEEALVGAETENNPHCCKSQTRAIGDVIVTDPSIWPAWLSQNTGLYTGAVLPDVMGYEVASTHGYQPTDTQIIGRSEFPGVLPSDEQIIADVTLYVAPSGAIVFSSGSLDWNLGLDDYGVHSGDIFGRSRGAVPAVQQLTRNFMEQVRQVPEPLPMSAPLPAMVSASSSASGYPASNLNSGRSARGWIASLTPSPANNHAWVQLDLGRREWVQRLRWTGMRGQPYPASSPTDYQIEISDDGVHWQTVLKHAGWAPVTQCHPSDNWQDRHFRFGGTENSSRNYCEVAANRTSTALVVKGDELINQQARYVRLVTTKVNDGTGWSLGLHDIWAEGAPPPPSGRLRILDIRTSNQPRFEDPLAWYQVDLGGRRQIDRVAWRSPDANAAPTQYAIQASDDGKSWNTVFISRNSSPAVYADDALTAQGRYLRIMTAKLNDGTGRSLRFSDFAVFGSAVSSVLAAHATASSEARGYPAENAVAVLPGKPWVASLEPPSQNNRAWFELDFGSRRQINRVRWLGAKGSPYPASSPTDYSIEVSDDGEHWTIVLTRKNASPVINGDELLNAHGRYMRIVTTKVNDGSGGSLGFYQFWALGY